ncbi:hypothetical protein [Bradyrhizobium sp. Leo170]|uniref:hypothetical protein n=1 Tax=Bradyrhizobium sp. Leo170 TaxID=1571199 RepID=UPI00102EB3D5|nr:hypothetical protein [Bradyrhizobium sp. Leo170]TAI60327.1 hypothetical protein CWO89_41260 [Bradyrhizobium sp. Leo170]
MRAFVIFFLSVIAVVFGIAAYGQMVVANRPTENLRDVAERRCAVDHASKRDRDDCVSMRLNAAALELMAMQRKEAIRDASR